MALGEHSNLLKVLDKDSEILADLLHDFTRTVNTVAIPLFCFFEQHKSDIAKVVKFRGAKMLMPTLKNAVVDESSGCLDGHPKLGLASEHFRLNKFSTAQDSNYRLVCEEIVRMVEAAPMPLAQPSPGEHDASDYMGSLSGLTLQAPAVFEERDCASIQALFVTDPADDMHMIANKKDRLLETTDSWMLRDATYQKWKSEDHTRVLWLHGDPGKGKTMLAIALVDDLTKHIRTTAEDTSSALVYFFCDNQDDRRANASLILRGILYQILYQQPELTCHLNKEYEKQRDQLFSSPNSIQTLWRVFHNVVRCSNFQKIYVIVDALDECDASSMETLLILLEPYIEVQDDSLLHSDHKDSRCSMRWLLTSRNELRISQLLTGSLNISLEEKSVHVNNAVFKFIDFKVKQLTKIKHYDDTLSALVGKTLREKAEGTFLWVALACRELSKPAVLSVNTEEVLLEMPAGITPLYSRIMDQVLISSDERSAVYIKSILQSMVVALRPLSLPELAVAAGLPHQYHDKLHVLEEYVHQCGSMVTIRERQAHFVHLSAKTYLQQAQFVHLSAKIHLLENDRGSIVSRDLRIENRKMAVRCFEYICSNSQSLMTGRESLPTIQEYAVDKMRLQKNKNIWLDYPSLFWMEHTKYASDDISDHFAVEAEFFKPDSVPRRIWFASYWAKTHSDHEMMPEGFTAMHLAAYSGMSWLLLKLLVVKNPGHIDARDSKGYSPLIWAARNGHVSVVQLLLDRRADISAKNHEGVTALYWAANCGHSDTVDLLLRNKANCKPRDKVGWTSLHRAAYNGHTGVVRTLLDNGANIEATDTTKWTALMRTATTGNVALTRLLLSKSAKSTARDMGGKDVRKRTTAEQHCTKPPGMAIALLSDVCSKRVHIRMKLTMRARPHCIKLRGAATLCSRSSSLSMVPTLILGTEMAKHHVHQAASGGSIAVVNMLLDSGADPRVEDNDGRKPHSLAEENFHHPCAKILREKEMEVYGGEVLPDLANIPQTSHPAAHLDSAVVAFLGVEQSSASIEPYGQAGFSTPSKVSIDLNGKTSTSFMKVGPDEYMFRGEYESLAALHTAVPSLYPQPLTHGKLRDSPDYYLLTDFIDIDASPNGQTSGLSLAQKLAQLHSTPPPIPAGFAQPCFGFHLSTCVGRTLQINTWNRSWPKFFAENRLRAVWRTVESNHGSDAELHSLLDRVVSEIVPRLLGNGHLGGRKGIQPALVHGDLWSGNKARGRVGGKGGIEDVVFDPGSCYAHSEYELGIMRMFGGFSAGFFNEYHRLIPKTHPKSEYDDRLSLYELYQWLNHYALFSGGYREDAMDCMEKLIGKYGQEEEEDEDDSSSDLS
ncbi:MAG: hypothetical protein Q9192_006031 [Flavoplaca navasiana]